MTEETIFRIVIQGVPPSVNHYYGNRAMGKRVIRYVTAEGKKFKQDLSNLFKEKYPSLEPFDNNCKVIIRAYLSDKRKRDVDNFGKAILDSMNGVIYLDDSQITKLVIEKQPTLKEAYTEIIVER